MIALPNQIEPYQSCKILQNVKILGQILGGKMYTISSLPFLRGEMFPPFPPLPTPMPCRSPICDETSVYFYYSKVLISMCFTLLFIGLNLQSFHENFPLHKLTKVAKNKMLNSYCINLTNCITHETHTSPYTYYSLFSIRHMMIDNGKICSNDY